MPNFSLSHKRPKVTGRMSRLSLAREWPPRPGFEASAPRSGPRTAGFSDEVAAGTKSEKMLWAWASQERIGDEAVHRVDPLRRADCHGRGGKCARFCAV